MPNPNISGLLEPEIVLPLPIPIPEKKANSEDLAAVTKRLHVAESQLKKQAEEISVLCEQMRHLRTVQVENTQDVQRLGLELERANANMNQEPVRVRTVIIRRGARYPYHHAPAGCISASFFHEGSANPMIVTSTSVNPGADIPPAVSHGMSGYWLGAIFIFPLILAYFVSSKNEDS